MECEEILPGDGKSLREDSETRSPASWRHVHKRQLDFKPELTLPVSRDSPRLIILMIRLNRRPKLQLEVEPSITTFKLSVIVPNLSSSLTLNFPPT